MVLFPEREKTPVPEGVTVRPDAPSPLVERTGAVIRPSQPTPITPPDQNVTGTTAQAAPTLQTPADTTTLTGWSKGSITNSLTWFALFWLRMIKKAIHFGWKVVGKSNATS